MPDGAGKLHIYATQILAIGPQETNMILLRLPAYGIGALLMLCTLLGCAASSGDANRSPANRIFSGSRMPASDKIMIFFYRQSNYTGGGRIHLLKVDGREIGELTGDNYYRLEIWPGEYQFSVFLPSESFFGQTSPPMSISERVRFEPGDTGGVFAYQFTDGMGSRGFERRRLTHQPAFLSNRSLAASLSARDTAQVTMHLNTRYDGPSIDGLPHGKGTLTWPDGSVYQGVFEHGWPTNEARFMFTNGETFMGLFYKGRPKSPGVLMDPDGRILFAGNFVEEKPNGVGLRTGEDAPEFCVFDHGRDITKTFRQLAQEVLDAEDEAQIEAFSRRIDHLRAQIETANEHLFKLKTGNITEGDRVADRLADLENSIRDLELSRSRMERTAATDQKKFIEALHKTRWERELIKIGDLKEDHGAKVEEERIWCQEEFAIGRKPCGCAPLTSDYLDWQTCEAPVGQRVLPRLNP
jgi:hypothetical protein